MCGRYATTRNEADLGELFEASDATGGLTPSWNVAPTDAVPVIRMSASRAERVVDTARWGLVPPWAKDLRAGARMINARSETVAASKAFAASFARRRCLVPADGWFEWLRDGKRKQPFYMSAHDGSVLAFAGIWSAWGPDSVLTCSVLTTAALGDLTRVHDRMPLILPRDRWAAWLGTPGGSAEAEPPAGHAGAAMGAAEAAALLAPMTPAALAVIDSRPVRQDVGNVRNNGPHLLDPPDPPAQEPALF